MGEVPLLVGRTSGGSELAKNLSFRASSVWVKKFMHKKTELVISVIFSPEFKLVDFIIGWKLCSVTNLFCGK